MKLAGSITFWVSFILAFRIHGQINQDLLAFKNLLDDPRPVAEISHINTYYFFDVGRDKLSLLGQKLVRNDSGLHVVTSGTGRVYKVKRRTEGVEITRIDSTIYSGNNFGAVPFSYRDTLYSLGGYGFWKSNGQLRVYPPNKAEWEVVALNTEIPFQSDYTFHWFWYDLGKGLIFAGYGPPVDQGIKQREQKQLVKIDSVAVLDLQRMEWTRLGMLSEFVTHRYGHFHNLGSSPCGQVIYTVDHHIQNNLYLLRYRNNKVLIADENKSKVFLQLTSRTQLLYVRDSIVYLGQLDVKP